LSSSEGCWCTSVWENLWQKTSLNWLMNWFKLQKTSPRQFQSSPLNFLESCGIVMVPVHPFLVKKLDWTRLLNTNHAILEYIQLVSLVAQNVFCVTNFRLTRKHDGVYLTTVVANCLKWFGLEKLVCFLFSFFFFNPS
jgi:hypothetical protein